MTVHATATLSLQKVTFKTNPYEYSGLVQIFWRVLIALYDEQIVREREMNVNVSLPLASGSSITLKVKQLTASTQKHWYLERKTTLFQ